MLPGIINQLGAHRRRTAARARRLLLRRVVAHACPGPPLLALSPASAHVPASLPVLLLTRGVFSSPSTGPDNLANLKRIAAQFQGAQSGGAAGGAGGDDDVPEVDTFEG